MTAEEIRTTLDEVSKLTGKTTLYYIGNVYAAPYRDDRSWAIRLDEYRDESNRHHFAPHNLNIGTTEEMALIDRDWLIFLLGRQVLLAQEARRASQLSVR